MKIKIAFLLVFLAAPIAACDNESNEPEGEPGAGSRAFEMRVDKIEKLEGVILKGIAISGSITKGCIANEDEYTVQADGEGALKEMARILKIEGRGQLDPETVEAVQGDYVSFYIPDAKTSDVERGDIVSSDKTSCQ